MKLLIYGDIGGSGGYIRYCKGLLGSKSIPDYIEVWFICGYSFHQNLLPLDPEVHVITHRWMTSKNRYYRYLWYFWMYPRIVRKINPDIEFYPSGRLRVYLRKAVTISTCHNLLLFDDKELGLITDGKERKQFYYSRKYQARTFQKSDGVIFLSDHSKELVSNKVSNIKRSTVIAHGLDTPFIFSTKRTYEFGKEIKILYVSPIYTYKHQIEVVKAVKILKELSGMNVSLQLLGDDTTSAAIELKHVIISEKVQEYVTLRGSVNYKDLIFEYKSADIFIFASSSETFGITLLEAMGARLPIACSNKSGLPTILKDAGLYFNPEDPEEMAEAVAKLIVNNKLREDLGERAYKYALEYTWEECARKTFRFIKRVRDSNS